DYKLGKPGEHWMEYCQQLDLAYLNMHLPSGSRYKDRDERLLKALRVCLKEFAEQSEHPELIDAPWIGIGNDSFWGDSGMLMKYPEKAIAHVVVSGKVVDPGLLDEKKSRIPMLYVFGEKPEQFNYLETIEKYYTPARKKGLPWSLGLQGGAGVSLGNAPTQYLPWLHAVIDARLPKELPPTGPVELREITEKDGWLAERSPEKGKLAALAPLADFKGEREKVIWLPSSKVARIWRAFSSSETEVELRAQSSYEHWQLYRYEPTKFNELMIYPIHYLKLSAIARKSMTFKSMKFFDGDTAIAQVQQDGAEYRWDKPGKGYHTLYAEWKTTDGKTGVT